MTEGIYDNYDPVFGERQAGGISMAKVLGLGGLFFKSRDPRQLGEWYQKWLGVPVQHPHGASFAPSLLPAGAFSVWAPFAVDTRYFDPSTREFMFNLVVDDLEGALAQVREGGAEVLDEVEKQEYGRFGWFIDPEGNKVELWEPPAEWAQGEARREHRREPDEQ
jgi:predicted enzyme related to lactoylglutathione lyase